MQVSPNSYENELQKEEVIRQSEGTFDDPPMHPLLKAWFGILFWGICIAVSIFVLGSWMYSADAPNREMNNTSQAVSPAP